MLVALEAIGAALAVQRRRPMRWPAVPAGDVAVPDAVVGALRRAGDRRLTLRLPRLPVAAAAVVRAEKRIGTWESGGVAVLLLVLALAAALGAR